MRSPDTTLLPRYARGDLLGIVAGLAVSDRARRTRLCGGGFLEGLGGGIGILEGLGGRINVLVGLGGGIGDAELAKVAATTERLLSLRDETPGEITCRSLGIFAGDVG